MVYITFIKIHHICTVYAKKCLENVHEKMNAAYMRMAETEFHFLLVCTHYVDLRRKYFPAYFCRWPSLNKFNTLLQSQSKHVLLNLSKFIYFAEKKSH